jgi:hypothetical protein
LKAVKEVQFKVFNIHDISAQTEENWGFQVVPSNAKSHEERGRVEVRIRMLRDTLERMGVRSDHPMTAMEWETVFARVANALNNVPVAKGNPSDKSDVGYELLTPNRLLLGRNNFRALGLDGFRLERNFQKILDSNCRIFHQWYQLFLARFHLFAIRPSKWATTDFRLPETGDIVLFLISDSGQGKTKETWKVGVVVENRGTAVVLECVMFSPGQVASKRRFTRSSRDVTILFAPDEFAVNSLSYFQMASADLFGD